MRALCGAIIMAGALLGMGLTAQGIGTRYMREQAYYTDLEEQRQDDPAPVGKPARVRLSDMDRPLIFILTFQTCAAIVGLGIAFLGLMYHHYRRDREYQWERERLGLQQPQRTSV